MPPFFDARLVEELPRILDAAAELGSKSEFAASVSREATALLEGTATAIKSSHNLGEAVRGIAEGLWNGHAAEADRLVMTRSSISAAGRLPFADQVFDSFHNIGIKGSVFETQPLFQIDSVTPSGQAIRTATYKFGSSVPEEVSYGKEVIDPQVFSDHRGINMEILTRPGSRQVVVDGYQRVNLRNFNTPPYLVDAVSKTEPVTVDSARIEKLMGRWVKTPRENEAAQTAQFVGFDHRTGEALTSIESDLKFDLDRQRYVSNLTYFHNVELGTESGASTNVVRDFEGRVFRADKLRSGGYSLTPSKSIMAFQPSELKLPGTESSIADRLSLPQDAGLRAQGGYRTDIGGKIPIGVNPGTPLDITLPLQSWR